MRKKRKSNKKIPYIKRLIPVIIAAILSYTIAGILLQAVCNVEISPTLTTAYFSFWGVELISIATIKTRKIKRDFYSMNESGE